MGDTSELIADATSAIDAALDTLVAADLTTLPARTLTSLVRSIARAETRLAGVTARAAAAAGRAGAVDAAGAPSTASWLADATGRNGHSAARTVSLGRAMETAPRVAAGLSDGSLSQDKAATLARAIDRGVLETADVDRLVDDAERLPAGVLAREVRAREARADNERLRRDEQWARQRRSHTHHRRPDGSVEGRYLLDPLAGDTLLTAIRAIGTLDAADTPPDQRRTRAQRDADALVDLARHALDDGVGGDELNVRPHVSVVVPIEALAPDGDHAAGANAVGTSDHGTMLSVQSVRTLLCDAAIRRVVVDPEGRPLDVGRSTRSWSGSQRAASAAVDGGCRGPSCDRPFSWTQLHHVDWWSNGGHTSLDRGLPLCTHCHHLVHDAGWTVDIDAATRTATWTSPGGRTTTTRPRGPAAPSPLTTLPAAPPIPTAHRPPDRMGTRSPTADHANGVPTRPTGAGVDPPTAATPTSSAKGTSIAKGTSSATRRAPTQPTGSAAGDATSRRPRPSDRSRRPGDPPRDDPPPRGTVDPPRLFTPP